MPGKRHHLTGTIGGAFLLISLLGCAMSPAPVATRSGDADLANVLESIRMAERLPAIAAAVIIGGRVHAAAAVGTRKINTDNWVGVDDPFLIASCAKAFTATLSAILIAQGHLTWDTTLKDVFPHIEMRREYEGITLLQLLSHRAGLPEWIDHLDGWWSDGHSSRRKRLAYLKESIKQPLPATPGSSVFYSNSGYIMAGALIETVMDQPFEQVIIEKLFDPLGMPSAGFGPPVQVDPAHGPSGHYGLLRSPISGDFPEYMAPTAAIHLSIGDWARFIGLHVNGQNAPAVDLGQDALLKLHTAPDSAPWRKGAEERGYGIPSLNYALGWYTLTTKSDDALLWHPGGNTGFIAQAVIDRRKGNAMLTVTNVRTSHRRLFRAMDEIRRRYAAIAPLPQLN